MSKAEPIYRVIYQSLGKLVEIYARNVYQGGLYGFVEVEELLFEEQQSELLVDPELEKLEAQFANVEITFIPVHAIVRIDQVTKVGKAKSKSVESGQHNTGNISYFPGMMPPGAPTSSLDE